MKRIPTEAEVRHLRQLQGTLSAQAAGLMFDLGAETVRRIWRRETHRKVADVAVGDAAAEDSINRLGELLSQNPQGGEEGTDDDDAA